MVQIFKKNNVEVVTMTADEYDAWVKVAQASSYKEFASEVSDGRYSPSARSRMPTASMTARRPGNTR